MINKQTLMAGVALLGILFLSACKGSKDQKEISGVINEFYAKGRIADYRYVNQQHLSSGLLQLIAAAAKKQTADSARLKAIGSTDKPLMIEGDIFTSLLEGNTSQEIKGITIGDQASKATVEFVNNNYPQYKWCDSVLLIKEAGVWKIDDILYTKGKGAGKGTRDVLHSFLQLAADTSSAKSVHDSTALQSSGGLIRSGRHGLSLQWLGWEKKGNADISDKGNGTYSITGQQNGDTKDEYVTISGTLKPVSSSELLFEGKIITRVAMLNKGKECVREGKYTFLAPAGKKYWRLQQMTNCEGGMAKDYIDIYQ